MESLRRTAKRLRVRALLPATDTLSATALSRRLNPVPRNSMQALLREMNALADRATAAGGSIRPIYRRKRPGPYHVISKLSDGSHVDLKNVRLPLYDDADQRPQAMRLFDARTAEFVRACTGMVPRLRLYPGNDPEITVEEDDKRLEPRIELLEQKVYANTKFFVPKDKCLAALAFSDYFPYLRSADRLAPMVSEAILASRPGWCGSFGPKVKAGLIFTETMPFLLGMVGEGNYDMSQMHLIPMAYRYFDKLTGEAREFLIGTLLAQGNIDRINEEHIVTSGGIPDDWSRAGYVYIPPVLPFELFSGKTRIGETENHILLIHTARYLSNQLLFQRDLDPNHDNRRNGTEDDPTSCTDLMLRLLRNFLRDDFSEYNAKSYQHETRTALLNLCSYAYDHEVRLAARMVLDYISAHVAVSSCDLRRMVPFRRRNEEKNRKLLTNSRFMDVGLLEWQTGCDPNTEHFAVQAGNLRAYESVTPLNETPAIADESKWRGKPWSVLGEGSDGMFEGLGEYRIPPLIHDLFVNDKHRRFFQRLHRTVKRDVESGQNCDNMEIYAGSPSYLITAGGAPAGWAIDPGDQQTFDPASVRKQVGVAVTTSFMPTGQSAGPGTQNYARDLIQFSCFAQEGAVENYGVAPDFVCGHMVHIPIWVDPVAPHRLFSFVDRGSTDDQPGFYLALVRDGEFTAMEAYDTWLHPGLKFGDFCHGAYERNKDLRLNSGEQAVYTTTHGHRIHFTIWADANDGDSDEDSFGARIDRIEYGDVDPEDRIGDASQVSGFLNGTILNSTEEALIDIFNPALGQRMTLDMRDHWHPRRTSETGVVEVAGDGHEVWVNFGWPGPFEGDFYRPFNTIAAAVVATAPGGVIKLMPGWTTERPFLSRAKRLTLVAPIGGVRFGVR